ncbi:MAG TPA: hypothetical protein VLT57_19900, partial [Bryobacteraceae bacterium]|nr:hypothetical protein [Bryobacteraceae bacterium]
MPAEDPRAIRARRDLRRVNAFMGNARIMARLLADSLAHQVPRTIAEIGAGDGTFLLQVARRIGPRLSGINVLLIDQQKLLSGSTAAGLQQL